MKKYFLIGEIHGTKECPEEFFKLIKKYKIKKIALEFLKDYQNEIDEFYSGKRDINKISFFRNKKKNHDGRASNAIKKLIVNLKKAKIKIFLIDEKTKNINERDKLMAKNLSKIKGKVAFLCGNIHARKNNLQLEKSNKMYKHYLKGKVKTCGSFLPSDKTISIKIHSINGGNFYNYKIQNHIKDYILSKKYPKEMLPKLIKSKDSAFDYFYLINKFTFSK